MNSCTHVLLKGVKFLHDEASGRMLAATKTLRQMIEDKIDRSGGAKAHD
jgi:hypothetical protein